MATTAQLLGGQALVTRGGHPWATQPPNGAGVDISGGEVALGVIGGVATLDVADQVVVTGVVLFSELGEGNAGIVTVYRGTVADAVQIGQFISGPVDDVTTLVVVPFAAQDVPGLVSGQVYTVTGAATL